MALRKAAPLLFLLFAQSPLLADSVTAKERTVTKLAEGVYEIRHKDPPDHFSQGNTVVIIGDIGVLVVDSCYLPSSAREDIAQIRQWTNKPIRYLLNTHWHSDHNFGNAAYADAFPTITIIAQTETAKLMALRNPSFLSDYPHRMEKFQKELDTGKHPGGTPLTDEEKEDLKNAVAGGKAASDAVSAEFRGLKVKVPDITFDHELDVDLGNREVQLKFLGRGTPWGMRRLICRRRKFSLPAIWWILRCPICTAAFRSSRSPR
jgi:cyclase